MSFFPPMHRTPIPLSLLRIKMRKLSVIRHSASKWKQHLRGHLLPVSIQLYLWIQTHYECFSTFYIFLLKNENRYKDIYNIRYYHDKKALPVLVCSEKKARDNFKSVTRVLSDEYEKRHKKNPACFLVRIWFCFHLNLELMCMNLEGDQLCYFNVESIIRLDLLWTHSYFPLS